MVPKRKCLGEYLAVTIVVDNFIRSVGLHLINTRVDIDRTRVSYWFSVKKVDILRLIKSKLGHECMKIYFSKKANNST